MIVRLRANRPTTERKTDQRRRPQTFRCRDVSFLRLTFASGKAGRSSARNRTPSALHRVDATRLRLSVRHASGLFPSGKGRLPSLGLGQRQNANPFPLGVFRRHPGTESVVPRSAPHKRRSLRCRRSGFNKKDNPRASEPAPSPDDKEIKENESGSTRNYFSASERSGLRIK